MKVKKIHIKDTEKMFGKKAGEGGEEIHLSSAELKEHLLCEIKEIRARKLKDWRQAEEIVGRLLAEEFDISHSGSGLTDFISVGELPNGCGKLVLSEVKSTKNDSYTFGGTQRDLMEFLKKHPISEVEMRVYIVTC